MRLIGKLQLVLQNTAARVLGTPLKAQVNFNILVLNFKALYSLGPIFL